MKQLLWICLLALPGILIAQIQTNDLRPVALVSQSADLLAEQLLETPFQRQSITSKNSLLLDHYQLLTLEEEDHQRLQHQTNDFLRLQLPLPDDQVVEVQLVEIHSPMPPVFTSSGEPVGELSPVRHYRGIIANDPQSIVALSVLDDGVQAIISSPDLGGNWVLGPVGGTEKNVKSSQTDYVFYQDNEVFQHSTFTCGTPDSGIGYTIEELRDSPADSRSLDNCVKVYFEVNNDIFQDKGGVAASAQYVTALFNQVATIYANDQINMTISEIMVWDTPSPYTSTNSAQMLNSFQATRTSFNGDIAQLLSYRASGGIAVVDGLCHPFNLAKMSYAGIGSTFREVPTYSWSVMVVAHELGHLLGSQHTHACVWNGNNTALDGCPGHTEGNCGLPGLPSEGGTIMSYCHLSQVGINLSKGLGPQPGALIRNRIAAANCLSVCQGSGGGDGNPPSPPTTGCTDEMVILRLQFDAYSAETSWVLRNAQQAIVAQGGPYAKALANQVLLDTFCLVEGCYVFEIRDSHGDGLCCNYGQGNYRLMDANQQVLAAGSEFTNLQQASFCVSGDNPNPPADDCTQVDFSRMPVISYGGVQDVGQHTVQDGGNILYLRNNAWKAVMLTYEVTRNTVIAFDFRSTRQGEIQGIGFDNDSSISFAYTARVYGTQNWGIGNYDNYPGNNGWKSYTIPIGEHYTGQFNRLFFTNDHDGGTRDGNSWFRNVRIYESTDCYANLPTSSAVSEHVAQLELSTYPNPVVGSQMDLRVQTPASGNGQWEVITTTGQLIQRGSTLITGLVTNIPIDVQRLTRGTYLLRWRDAVGDKTIRFIRQ